jgi:hypothetical protein
VIEALRTLLILAAPVLPPGPPSWRERDVVLMGIVGAVLFVVGIALIVVRHRLRRRQDETFDEL